MMEGQEISTKEDALDPNPLRQMQKREEGGSGWG